jgi:ABC-2 type transport system ATP-binding protein
MMQESNISVEKLFDFRNLSLMYGTVVGVNDLQLSLPKGAYALIGPNGAGKSTLIGLITGAIRPTLGSLSVLGENPRNSSTYQKRIGVCPATELLVHGVTSKQWLVQLIRMCGWSKKLANQRADQVLEQVGLADARNQFIHTYSLGMRQRCKLAQAIAHEPELLILDEPFNGLDPIGRHQMGDLLIDWAKSGKSLLLASHVLHEVERITDSFLLIFGGRLLASGTTGELRRLLADLPHDIIIQSQTLERLAALLAEKPWIRALHRDTLANRLVLTVDRPMELYESLATWAGSGRVSVERISGSDGDISTLFKLLISRHRGERAYRHRGPHS